MAGYGTRSLGVATWGRPAFLRGVSAPNTDTTATTERTATLQAGGTGTINGGAS